MKSIMKKAMPCFALCLGLSVVSCSSSQPLAATGANTQGQTTGANGWTQQAQDSAIQNCLAVNGGTAQQNCSQAVNQLVQSGISQAAYSSSQMSQSDYSNFVSICESYGIGTF